MACGRIFFGTKMSMGKLEAWYNISSWIPTSGKVCLKSRKFSCLIVNSVLEMGKEHDFGEIDG